MATPVRTQISNGWWCAGVLGWAATGGVEPLPGSGCLVDAEVAQQVGREPIAGAGHRRPHHGPLITLGDAWAWDRKNQSADVTPLVAATLALWGFTSKAGRPRNAGRGRVIALG
jgi:hypothetical protein